MRRITSIRPGETFETNFAAYPVTDLLIDLLRSNVTGGLQVEALQSDETFYFREGVPISSSSDTKAVHEALTRLVAEGQGGFRFTEGDSPSSTAPRAVLRTLRIVFEGLRRPGAGTRTQSFLDENSSRPVRLTDTYPRGANPFGFPDELLGILDALEEPVVPSALASSVGRPADLAAALLALQLAEMITFQGEVTGSRPGPIARAPAPVAAASSELVLMVDGDCGAAGPGPNMPSSEAQSQPAPERLDPLRSQRAEIARAVDPLRGKDYLEILRVTADTKADQIERSKNYLAKQLAKGEGPGAEAIRDLLAEAASVLCDPAKGAEYRKLAKNATTQKLLRKRQAFEAAQKLRRVPAKIAAGQFGTAAYLIDWAVALDPDLPEVPAHRHFLEFCLNPGPAKPEFAITLRMPMEELMVRLPSNLSIRLYLVILYVAMGEGDAARSLLSGLTGADHHALYPLAQVAVAALG